MEPTIDPLTAVAVLATWWLLRPAKKNEKEEAKNHG